MHHTFDVDEATKYGILGAVLLQNIRFWVQKNAANDKHLHDGKYWTYNSVAAFSSIFPYATSKQIRKALDDLEADGVLFVGGYNENPYDRTRWFSCHIDLPCGANEVAFQGKSLSTDVNTVVKDASATPPSLQKALAKKGQTFVDENFEPNDACKLKATKFGLNIDIEKEKFILNAQAKALAYANWQAAFQTWLMNAFKWKQTDNTKQPEQVMREY